MVYYYEKLLQTSAVQTHHVMQNNNDKSKHVDVMFDIQSIIYAWEESNSHGYVKVKYNCRSKVHGKHFNGKLQLQMEIPSLIILISLFKPISAFTSAPKC